MKKSKTIIFIAAVIAIFAALIYITGKYPPPSADETGGTIGKVEKYRKVQMTAKDIILRSEVIEDTSKLSKSIYGLMVFNTFIKNYSEDLKAIARNMDQCQDVKKDSKTLLDYSAFIDQNRNNVENMIALLTDFYTNDTTDFSVDIEKKLIDFDSFVKNIISRDSLVSGLISASEKIVKSDPKRKDEEIKKLKNIHDQLLIRKLQLAIAVGNNEQLQQCSQLSLFNVYNVVFFARNDLSVIASKEQLQQSVLNDKSLGVIFNTEKLGYIQNKQNLGSVELGVLLNKDLLSCCQKQNLGVVASQYQLGLENVQQFGVGLAVLADSYLGVIIPNTVNSKELQNVLSNSILNQTVQQKVLNSAIMNTTLGVL